MKLQDLEKYYTDPKNARFACKWDLFNDEVTLLAESSDDDYQGYEVAAFSFPDGTCAVIADSFGSCSYCDGWLGACDDGLKEKKEYQLSLIRSATLFDSLDELIEFAENVKDDPCHYREQNARDLLPDLLVERDKLNEKERETEET